MTKKKNEIDWNHLTPEDSLKLEIAAEIGVYEKVVREGWRGLSAKESGRIGGLLSRRKRELQNENKKNGCHRHLGGCAGKAGSGDV